MFDCVHPLFSNQLFAFLSELAFSLYFLVVLSFSPFYYYYDFVILRYTYLLI